MRLSLPGRGRLQRVNGVFGRNKYEVTAAQRNELPDDRISVVVTLRSPGDGTPIGVVSYLTEDRESISS